MLRNVLLLAAAAAAATTTIVAVQAVPPAARDFCVVGAGPGGLQSATLLAERGNDFALFEKNDNGGSFYRKYPIHRTLISINKRATSRGHSPEFNERHDWNSLLSNNDSLKMARYSRKFYPSADELVQYLEDYSQRLMDISPANSVHFSTEVVRVSRAEGSETALDLHTRPVSIEDDLDLDGGDASTNAKTSVTRCGRVIWATGTQPKGLEEVIEGADLDGVEHYSEVDPTSERYFNESVALIGAGNAGMEIATALQNTVGFIALMSDFQFSWRSHYVGDVRSVNAQFVDGYLLKSLDYINSGGRFNMVKRNHAHGKLQIDMKRPQGEAQIVSTAAGDRVETDGEQAKVQKEQPGQDEMMMNISAWDLEKNTDVCEVDMDGCKNRLHAESARGSILGFDRVIFCTGFRFKMADPPEPGDSEEEKKRKSLFDSNVRPVLNRDGKYPQQSRTYQSRNVKGLYFAGALAHELDFKRSAGGFIHGFRYTARALHHILVHDLPRDRPGSRDWPSVPLTKKEFIGGELAQVRFCVCVFFCFFFWGGGVACFP
jgi:thioredoxin reductase